MATKTDPRKTKRAFRKMGMSDPVYCAFAEGQNVVWSRPMNKQQNPYPPGRRHDEFERGREADKVRRIRYDI